MINYYNNKYDSNGFLIIDYFIFYFFMFDTFMCIERMLIKLIELKKTKNKGHIP